MNTDTWYMPKPCAMCPFRKDVNFHFSEERASDFAYLATNPYNSFPCHKTADYIDSDDDYSGGYVHGETSKECAGFMTLQICEGAEIPDGFTPAFDDVYEDAQAMIDRYAYED